MSRFQAALTHPVFSRWFAQVNPLFWPVLYWQMGRHFRWMAETGYLDLMVRIEWWGGITVVFTGDKAPGPSAYTPLARTFRPLTDASWSSDLPVIAQDLHALAAWHTLLLLPRFSGGSGSPHRGLTEGAPTSPQPNTS